MSSDIEKEKRGIKDFFKGYIGGDINQTQDCNVNVQQPNNNVICSKDTKTEQSTLEGCDFEASKDNSSKSSNKENNPNSSRNIKQNATASQKVEQPESNVYNVEGTTVNQINKGKGKKEV